MELSACIVVYNGAEEALKAAQTVLECTRRHPLTLYLVDNASPDGSGDRLAKAAKDGTLHIRENQKVEVLCRTENGGFGTGHNTVLSLLQSKVHFILNPDIQLTADTLSDLADWMAAHPDAVMARPALTFPDGQPQMLPLRRCNVRAMAYRQLPCLKFWAKYNERYLMADKDLTNPPRSSSAPAASRRWTRPCSRLWAVLMNATSCMWRTPTSPRRCAPKARRILCPSTPPSTPGTVLPTAA